MIKSNTAVKSEQSHGIINSKNLYDGIFSMENDKEIRKAAIKSTYTTFYPKTLVNKINKSTREKKWKIVISVWEKLVLHRFIKEINVNPSGKRAAIAHIEFNPAKTCIVELRKLDLPYQQSSRLLAILRDRQTISILITKNLPALVKFFLKIKRTNFLLRKFGSHQIRGTESMDLYQTVLEKLMDGRKSWNFRKYTSITTHIFILMTGDLNHAFDSKAGKLELNQTVLDTNKEEDTSFFDRQPSQKMNPYEQLVAKEKCVAGIDKAKNILLRKKSKNLKIIVKELMMIYTS